MNVLYRLSAARSILSSTHNRRLGIVAPLFAFFFLFLPVRALFAQIDQQAEEIPARIVAVQFQGNHQISSDELGSVISTKAVSWFSNTLHSLPLHLLGAYYQTLNYSQLERDTSALANHYRDNGFLDARVNFRIAQDTSGIHAYYEYLRQERLMSNAGKLSPPLVEDTVIFDIHEGEPYTISRIAIEGLDSLPNEFQPELTTRVTIKRGERWSRVAAASEVNRLIGILIENGYPYAREDSIVVQHTQGYHTVNLLIYFHSGHRYRYGPIQIIYDTTAQAKGRVADDVILAQLYIDSGHWYKLSEIQRSEANLNKLGTFDLFRVALDTAYIRHLPPDKRDSSAIPVEVYLRMKLTSSVSFNAYGGEGSQDLILGLGTDFTLGNFTGAADRFDAQGSYQFFPPPTKQRRYSASIEYTRPYIGLGTIPLITGVGYSYQAQQGGGSTVTYSFLSFTTHVGSSIVLSRTDTRTTLSPDILAAEVLNSLVFPDTAFRASQQLSSNDTIPSQRFADSVREARSIAASDSSIQAALPHQQINLLPSITWQDDRTNDPVNPTAGDLLSTTLEVGVPSHWLFNKTSSDYEKLFAQIKEYFDLSGGKGTAVVAARLEGGYCWFMKDKFSTYPALDHRFFSGGGATIRGWGEQQLLISGDSNAITYLGGYSTALFNLELRYAPFQYAHEFTTWQSLSSPIRIVLFYDAGNAWDQIMELNRQEVSLAQIAQSFGIGLRYNTFFGALRVDLGWKLYDPTGNFDNNWLAATPASHGAWIFSAHSPFFKFGNTMNFHFGIGQAF